MSEEVLPRTSSVLPDEPDDEKPVIPATEKLVTESMIITPPSVNHRTFAPLNIPLSRRRQTLTILVWFLLPWFCLSLSFVLLRCQNWYVVSVFIGYLTWMVFFQKYPRTGGMKQQWLRRLSWWTWFAGKDNIIFK
jgi:hypothetical protein